MKLIGKISGCAEASEICGYRCCDQDKPTEDTVIRTEDYILMYPGEYNPDDSRQKHLTPVASFSGGILARCAKECFDQSQCDPDVNYKPLDCRSYPLMATVADDSSLELVKDERCPLTRSQFGEEHELTVLGAWQEVVSGNPAVIEWLSNLSLEGYTK